MTRSRRRVLGVVGALVVGVPALWVTLPFVLQRMGLHAPYEGQRYLLPQARALLVTTSHEELGPGGAASGVFGSELTAVDLGWLL